MMINQTSIFNSKTFDWSADWSIALKKNEFLKNFYFRLFQKSFEFKSYSLQERVMYLNKYNKSLIVLIIILF